MNFFHYANKKRKSLQTRVLVALYKKQETICDFHCFSQDFNDFKNFGTAFA